MRCRVVRGGAGVVRGGQRGGAGPRGAHAAGRSTGRGRTFKVVDDLDALLVLDEVEQLLVRRLGHAAERIRRRGELRALRKADDGRRLATEDEAEVVGKGERRARQQAARLGRLGALGREEGRDRSVERLPRQPVLLATWEEARR